MTRLADRILPDRLGGQFRRLVLSTWVSNIGDGIALAAGPLLIASLTRDPLLVALAPMLQMLPWLVVGLYAGAIADRVDRKLMVLLASGIRVSLTGLLVGAIWLDRINIWLVLGVLFCFGVAEIFADTASSTLPPMLVEDRDLGVANSRLLAGHTTFNQFLGPPIGAALFAVGWIWPFATQFVALIWAVQIFAKVQLPEHGVERAERPHIMSDIRDGVRWLWTHGPLRTLALVIFSFNLTWAAAWAVQVLYAQDHLGMSAVEFGLLTTISAIGGLIGTLSYDWLDARFSPAALMKVCLISEVLMYLGFALATHKWQAYGLMFGFGLYAYVWWTVGQTIRQRAVPTELQGRVASVYLVGVFGGIVIGNLIGGLIARQWGILAPYWYAFFGTALILALVWRQLPLIAHAPAPAANAGPVDTWGKSTTNGS